jgi:hypothetical protein
MRHTSRTKWRIGFGISIAAMFILAASGVIAWRMHSPGCASSGLTCPAGTHRVHPLRAEALWAIAIACALAAGVSAWFGWAQARGSE